MMKISPVLKFLADSSWENQKHIFLMWLVMLLTTAMGIPAVTWAFIAKFDHESIPIDAWYGIAWQVVNVVYFSVFIIKKTRFNWAFYFAGFGSAIFSLSFANYIYIYGNH